MLELKELKENITDIERLQQDISNINNLLEWDNKTEYMYSDFITDDDFLYALRETHILILNDKQTELEIKMKKIKEKVLIK